MFSFVFLSWETGTLRTGLLKISRHYFVFSFSFFFLSYSYLARDSCKKWQEIINKLGLISQIEHSKISRHYFFSFSFILGNWDSRERTVEYFLSLFCFCFCFCFFLSIILLSRAGYFKNVTRNYKTAWVQFPRLNSGKLSRHFFFVFFSFSFSFENWTVARVDSRIFLVTILFLFLFSLSHPKLYHFQSRQSQYMFSSSFFLSVILLFHAGVLLKIDKKL